MTYDRRAPYGLAPAMLLLAGMLTFLSIPAEAAVSVKELDGHNRFAHLAVTGEITKADADDFARLVSTIRPKYGTVDVELKSPGGDVAAAMQIGRLIRSNSIWTIAPDDPGNLCASACVLILAGGVVRIAGDDSVVEIHRPYFQQKLFAKMDLPSAQRQYGELAKSVQGYLSQMGMSDVLFQEMLKVPSDQGRILSSEEMQQIGLTGWDPAYQEWLKARSRH